jgi:flagellar biosynthesis protein FliR
VEALELTIDPGWVTGLLLAISRVSGFVVASPLIARVLPIPARLAVTIALGYFLASPPEVEPTVPFLLAAGAVNVGIGVALGFLTGTIIHLFGVAGSVIDMTSGLAAAAVFDPVQAGQGAVFNRMFGMLGLVLFYVVGGLSIVVRGLALSVEAIPLDGAVAPSTGLAGLAATLTGKLFLAGVELAVPVVAALFLTELVLGVASRFAPQANIFMIGLPAKIFVALTMSSICLALFPETVDGVLGVVRDSFTDGIRLIRG